MFLGRPPPRPAPAFSDTDIIRRREPRALLPFTDTAPRAARPAAVLALIAVNALVFLWTLTLPPDTLNAVFAEYALIP